MKIKQCLAVLLLLVAVTLVSFLPTESSAQEGSQIVFQKNGKIFLIDSKNKQAQETINAAVAEEKIVCLNQYHIANDNGQAEKVSVENSIELKEGTEPKIFPNPLTNVNFAHVRLSNLTNEENEMTIKVFDAIGKEIYSRIETIANEETYEIKFEQPLSSGIYIVTVSNTNEKYVRKLMAR